MKTILFSDTIVFYEEIPKPELISHCIIDPSQFMYKACTLLRLAFEGGIPLRGAISYGEYYIHDRAFLGKPIIEAHNFEIDQKWSGAALCRSAKEEYLRRLQIYQKQSLNPIISVGDNKNINPILAHNFIPMNCLSTYPIPCNRSNLECLSLCWDDSVLFLGGLREKRSDIKRLNLKYKKQIYNRVEEKFNAHGKPLDKNVKHMIKNTANFIFTIKEGL